MIKRLFSPFTNFKLKYLPILFIYFANSFAAFTKIAETYWMKDSFSLTPSELTSISIWSNLPWTMKIIFGQFIDSVRIKNSQRYIYVYIASFILSIGIIINIFIANNYYVKNMSIYSLLIISGALIQLGLAIQDLVADTLCYDAVDKYDNNGNQLSDDVIKDEIAKIQIIVKVTDIIAAMLAAIISGFIASRYSYANISYFSLVIVIISILGIIIYPKEPYIKLEKFNPQIIYGGILYLLFILFIALLRIDNSDIFILTVGTLIISYLLHKLCEPLEKNYRIEIFKMLLIIFAFRATPSYGRGSFRSRSEVRT
ncbi:MAG: hypothetical protein EOP34_08095 [Rickettsiales bacterium]|nr:MAG: hypothetical protein EOP34_08095 [Rickettsiales bacterium]